jgi:mannose-6-phosphate isomerase-like protein (cupin superfamily)
MKTIKFERKWAVLPTVLLIAFAMIFGCTAEQKEVSESITDEAAIEYVANTQDSGGQPLVFNIEEATIEEDYYRKAIWTGKHMQLVLMSLKPGEKIDLEQHSKNDQFFRVESGKARVQMGETKDNLTFDQIVSDDFAILIPAGYWHQITNIGETDLKLYTIYGPSEHAPGTKHATYKEAQEYGHDHHH